MNRADFINCQLKRVDGDIAGSGNPKHQKMCISPFVFYRGTSQLFYADLAANNIDGLAVYEHLPLTTVMGDCHTSNFGFFSEEGSFGERIIFSLNDFDDACIGPAIWDLLRFTTSLVLVADHCQGVVLGDYESDKDRSAKPFVDSSLVESAITAFLDGYCYVLEQGLTRKPTDAHFLDLTFENFGVPSALKKRFKKARKVHVGGDDFLTKSALAKAVDFDTLPLQFRQREDKFTRIDNQAAGLKKAFAPYFYDQILDIVERKNAGTGSVNMQRYYALIGPKNIGTQTDIPLCHVIEIKQQRQAAPIHYFPEIHHQNQLNPSHLTVKCQRRMQRRQDYVLDEAYYQNKHWLIRSRHHAKVGIDPEHIGIGDVNVNQGGFSFYAAACGQELARAHCRGDRRSLIFEQAMLEALTEHGQGLITTSHNYADQVIDDWRWLRNTER